MGQGFVEQFLNRPPARFLAEILAATGLRPWHVVILGLVMGLLASLYYSSGEHLGYLVAAILLQIRSILDCLDGELARVKGLVTDRGHALDGVADFVVSVTLHVSIAYGVYSATGDVFISLVALASFLSVSFQTAFFFHYKTRLFTHSLDPSLRSMVPHTASQASQADPIVRLERIMYDWVDKTVAKTNYLKQRLLPDHATQDGTELGSDRNQLRVLGLWSYLSVGTHAFALIVLSLLGYPVLYFYLALLLGNPFLVLLLVLQRRADLAL